MCYPYTSSMKKGGVVLTRKSIVLAGFLGVGIGLLEPARSETPPWPVQLEMRVPFEPTAFPSSGHTHLVYELYLTNFTSNPVTLRRVEVLDADPAVIGPVAGFEGKDLDSILQPIGGLQDRKGAVARLKRATVWSYLCGCPSNLGLTCPATCAIGF